MNAQKWNEIVTSFPDPHILQTWQWGQVKANTGWEPVYWTWGNKLIPEAAAMILQKKTPIPGLAGRLKILYIPKGPLVRDWSNPVLVNRVMDALKSKARKHGAVFLKIDPDVPLGMGFPGDHQEGVNPIGTAVQQQLKTKGWYFSGEQIQFRNTVLIDLQSDEDEILARMKQKTRYNIRLARRKGVVVRPGGEGDLALLFHMYAQTALRDGFVIRDEEYYHSLWHSFLPPKTTIINKKLEPVCEPIIAEAEGEPVAAAVIFRFAGKSYYMHGMSRPIHRNKMPNYMLQWEAISRAKAAGCEYYDLWGAPDSFEEKDPMWGVFRFKQGLGGEVQRTIGAYDLPLKPFFYKIYSQAIPRLLGVMRKRGILKTKRIASTDHQSTMKPS